MAGQPRKYDFFASQLTAIYRMSMCDPNRNQAKINQKIAHGKCLLDSIVLRRLRAKGVEDGIAFTVLEEKSRSKILDNVVRKHWNEELMISFTSHYGCSMNDTAAMKLIVLSDIERTQGHKEVERTVEGDGIMKGFEDAVAEAIRNQALARKTTIQLPYPEDALMDYCTAAGKEVVLWRWVSGFLAVALAVTLVLKK